MNTDSRPILQLMREKADLYERLMRLDKPIGILLLFWPTLWALWISAHGKPSWIVVWIFTLGTVLMRSAGCVINDLADRDFDPHVARTKDRPLAAGKVSTKEALLLFGLLVSCAFVLILPFRSWSIVGLSVVALFLAATYPLTKRFFAVPQAYLGVAFGFGIPMAFMVNLNAIPPVGWWMLLANVFWAMAYDTEYAMVDRADDLKIGIKTSAITFGRFDVLAIMLCHTLFLLLMGVVGAMAGLGAVYLAGLMAAGVLIMQQYRQIRPREPAACFAAFLANNRVGAVVCAGLVLDRGWALWGAAG